MSSVAKAFENNRRDQLFRRPQPVSQAPAATLPWQIARNGEIPPLMFQLRFLDGTIISYTYGDLREIRYRDAGHLQLGIYGMSKLVVTIEGRNLRELPELLGSGVVYWLQEADEREVDIPESSPQITAMTVAAFTEE